MKVREETRRLLDALGQEIRDRFKNHNCKEFNYYSCVICDMSRSRQTVLASLAFMRSKFKSGIFQNTLTNENELLDLLGRDKLIINTKHQLNLVKTCIKYRCKACGVHNSIFFGRKALAIGLKMCTHLGDCLSIGCRQCGAYIEIMAQDLPEVDMDTISVSTKKNCSVMVRNHFIIMTHRDRDNNQLQEEETIDDIGFEEFGDEDEDE